MVIEWLQADTQTDRQIIIGIIRQGQEDYYLLHSVQSGSGPHPASYAVGTGGYFPGGKAAGFVNPTTRLHLVPRSRMVSV
jgi:hypothetical protein